MKSRVELPRSCEINILVVFSGTNSLADVINKHLI